MCACPPLFSDLWVLGDWLRTGQEKTKRWQAGRFLKANPGGTDVVCFILKFMGGASFGDVFKQNKFPDNFSVTF